MADLRLAQFAKLLFIPQTTLCIHQTFLTPMPVYIVGYEWEGSESMAHQKLQPHSQLCTSNYQLLFSNTFQLLHIVSHTCSCPRECSWELLILRGLSMCCQLFYRLARTFSSLLCGWRSSWWSPSSPAHSPPPPSLLPALHKTSLHFPMSWGSPHSSNNLYPALSSLLGIFL